MSVHHLHDRNFLLEPLNVFHLALQGAKKLRSRTSKLDNFTQLISIHFLTSLVVHCEIQHDAAIESWKTEQPHKRRRWFPSHSHCAWTNQQTESGIGTFDHGLTALRSVSSNNLSFCFQCFMMFSQWFHEVSFCFLILLGPVDIQYDGLLLWFATLPGASQQCRPSQLFSPLGLHLWPCSCLCKHSHRT